VTVAGAIGLSLRDLEAAIPVRYRQWVAVVVAEELEVGRIIEHDDGVLAIEPGRFDARTLAALRGVDLYGMPPP
jgi:hypothetical protein